MSQFNRHEPETAELLEAFEMLGQLAAMPSEREPTDDELYNGPGMEGGIPYAA